MRNTTRVTILQFSGEGRDPAHDLDAMRDEVRAHRGSDLVIFPEFALRTSEDPAMAARLLASEGPAVVFGELREDAAGVWDLATYADARTTRSYAKTHVHWSETFAEGHDFPVIRTPLGPTGFLICFDAAFAEVPLALTLAGAKAIINVSAIPAQFPLKIVHRRLVACSVMNQVFTFFANRTGPGHLGGSAVVDPQGEILAVAGPDDRSLTVDVDMNEVDAWRAVEPAFAHRRPGIYHAVTQPAAPRTPATAAGSVTASAKTTIGKLGAGS